MATLEEIAERSGVSSSTVSRYLRGILKVSPERQKRIDEAVEALNYVANANARSLVKQRSGVVGLVLPGLSNPFFAALADAIADEVARLDVSLVLCTTRDIRAREERYADLVEAQAVDGVLYIGAHPSNSRLARVIKRGLPVVIVDEPQTGLPPVTTLTVDNFGGGFQATSYLLSLGHERICYLGGLDGLLTERERRRGFAEALTRAGIQVVPDLVISGGYSERFGVASLPHLLTSRHHPTAVFCASDHTALGLISAAHRHGIALPDELSVVGFDDIGAAAYTTPELTTIRQPIRDIAKNAVEMLAGRIDHPSAVPEQRALPVELIVRESAVTWPTGSAARPFNGARAVAGGPSTESEATEHA